MAIQYIPEIDGLRALAVIAVVLFHAGIRVFSGGFIGVDIFFVISGYLITTIILSDINSGTFVVSNFYEKRARRIVPALSVVMLFCIPFSWFLLTPADLERFSQSLIAVSLFSSNIFFYLTSGYFDLATELKPLIHTWSLAVEEQFYFIFPLILLLINKYNGRLILLFAFLSFGVAEWGNFFNNPATELSFKFYLLPARAWELLIGSLIAVNNPQRIFDKKNKILHEFAGALGMLLIGYSIFFFNSDTPFPSVYALVPTIGSGLIILYATEKTFTGRILGGKLLSGIGLISYSAYLWHQPLFAFAKYTSYEEPRSYLIYFLIPTTFFIGWISWKYIEIPFRNKQFISKKWIFIFTATSILFFIILGCIGLYSKGFLNKYEGKDKILAEAQYTNQYIAHSRIFNEYNYKNFKHSDSRKKIVIIGDSFAEDLVNSLHESGAIKDIQISTRHIIDQCGNLFLDEDEFKNKINKEMIWRCKGEKGIYADKNLRRIMLESDEIWFVSKWHLWQIPFIPKSIMNTESFSGKKIKVFGRKNFGQYKFSTLLGLTNSQRISEIGRINEESIEVNLMLQNILSPYVFVDTQKILCGSNNNICRIFTDDGYLISFDGEHLTKYGAKYFGDKLLESGISAQNL